MARRWCLDNCQLRISSTQLIRTDHGRHAVRDAAPTLLLCELERSTQLKERVAAKDGADEDSVGFEEMADLGKGACGGR